LNTTKETSFGLLFDNTKSTFTTSEGIVIENFT